MINNILIIEDEHFNAERLKRMIYTVRPNSNVLTVLDSIAEAVQWLNENEKPDLIMMDIRLSDGLSFEIFEHIHIDIPVIFTTAFNEYAVKAFKYNAVDYLLKPIEEEELENALKKVDEIDFLINNQRSIKSMLNTLMPKEYRSRFLLPFRDGYKTFLVSDVICFYLDLKIIKARLKNGSDIFPSQSLEALEQQLDPKYFFRANRQFIIHIDAVKDVLNYFNGKLKVVLHNMDIEILVSKEKSKAFKDWLDF